MVQASHAAIAAARSGLITEHPSLVVCSVPSERELLDESTRLCRLGIPHELFFEDDVQSYTALATGTVTNGNRKLFREWKLLK